MLKGKWQWKGREQVNERQWKSRERSMKGSDKGSGTVKEKAVKKAVKIKEKATKGTERQWKINEGQCGRTWWPVHKRAAGCKSPAIRCESAENERACQEMLRLIAVCGVSAWTLVGGGSGWLVEQLRLAGRLVGHRLGDATRQHRRSVVEVVHRLRPCRRHRHRPVNNSAGCARKRRKPEHTNKSSRLGDSRLCLFVFVPSGPPSSTTFAIAAAH